MSRTAIMARTAHIAASSSQRFRSVIRNLEDESFPSSMVNHRQDCFDFSPGPRIRQTAFDWKIRADIPDWMPSQAAYGSARGLGALQTGFWAVVWLRQRSGGGGICKSVGELSEKS